MININYDIEGKFWENMDKQIVYWRKNIHRFIAEYFGVRLAEFQKVILYEMARDTSNLRQFMFWASRGTGKSFLTLLFAIAMGVLYPGIKIVISSPTVDQSNSMVGKLGEIKEKYPNIGTEIEGSTNSKDGSSIKLKNTSIIYTVTCNNNARGKRCQVLILDEFIGMDKTIIDDVLAKFLTEPRYPLYRNINKYKDFKNNETNRKIYLSSINTSTEWSYEEFLAFNKMIERGDENYYTISVPYQFGVRGGMINKGYIQSEVNNPTTDINKFRSEMECIPLGEGDSALFRYENLNRRRVLNEALYPMTDEEYFVARQGVRNDEYRTVDELQRLIRTRCKYYQPKLDGEVRIISADIASVGGTRNDDSAYIVYRLFPERVSRTNYETGQEEIQLDYMKQIAHIETNHGMRIDDQAVRLKQLFYDLECDYIVLDAMSIGGGVYDICAKRTYDVARNKFYPAWCAMNGDEDMRGRVMDEDAEDILYSMKTAGRNSGRMHQEMVTTTTIGLDRDKICFLKSVADVYDDLDDKYNYRFLKDNPELRFNEEAKRLMKPFEITSTLTQQAISTKKIEQKTGTGIMIKEAKSTDKKDILMSFLYGMYLISILERELVFEERTVDYSRMAFAANENKNQNIPSVNVNASRGFGGFSGFGGFGGGSGYRSFFN